MNMLLKNIIYSAIKNIITNFTRSSVSGCIHKLEVKMLSDSKWSVGQSYL